MTVRIGVSPIAWSNDDLVELGGATPIEQCLDEAREAGYSGIELGHKFPRNTDTLATLLGRHRLRLISGWYGARLLERSVADEIDAMGPHLELLSTLGCTVMVFAEVTGSVHGDPSMAIRTRPRLHPDTFRRFCDALTRVGEYMHGHGVDLAYHHHVGTVVESEAEIDRLMEHTGPSVALLLDTGHATHAGADAARVAEKHAERIVHVHLKDVRANVLERTRHADMSFLDSVRQGVFTVPGDGMIDFSRTLRALADAGYQGWLVVEAEQDPAIAKPSVYARRGYEHVTRAARDAGLVWTQHT